MSLIKTLSQVCPADERFEVESPGRGNRDTCLALHASLRLARGEGHDTVDVLPFLSWAGPRWATVTKHRVEGTSRLAGREGGGQNAPSTVGLEFLGRT